MRNAERDRSIARHVLGVHINASLSVSTGNNSSDVSQEIPAATLKKFVTYCRERYFESLFRVLNLGGE